MRITREPSNFYQKDGNMENIVQRGPILDFAPVSMEWVGV